MGFIKVSNFLSENKKRLNLDLIAGQKGLDNTIISLELNRPGLALAGFIDLFTYNRVQLIGNTELLYLNSLQKKEKIEAFEIICQFDIPCIFFTNGKYPTPELVNVCSYVKLLFGGYFCPLYNSSWNTYGRLRNRSAFYGKTRYWEKRGES